MHLASKYNPVEVEKKWYDYWMAQGYFNSEPNEKKPFTIVMPPPNVTGVLHMGHMLNNTIQDVLIRRARLRGYNACWIPGTDHASIATETKVVAHLKKKGINKEDLTREEFLKHTWKWTKEHGGIILEQLKKIGASCDWKRTKFTMDPSLSQGVKKTFIDLYNKGMIYRGYRMINWDSMAKTAVSDEEIVYQKKEGKLYYIKYRIQDSLDNVVIATTRPETILADSAVCINPKDKTFNFIRGKKVIVPIVNRCVPVIEDSYVDMEFGTGCLKITPAHDPNDKIIGEKHKLDFIDIFNSDATLNDKGLHYRGKDRFVARREIVKELEESGHIDKIEDYTHKVSISERTKCVIEPRISLQWFVKMEKLVAPALKAVFDSKDIHFFPKHYKNTYGHWLKNIRDWNISRQLWWGHQIPAYFYGEGENDFVVALSKEEALKLAREKSGNSNLSLNSIFQDPDTLDTWFSSWLWPISVFDGINNPDNPEINYYYPTDDLVTAPDIIFFWVARMIFAGYQYRQNRPFKNVYFTGIVKDKQGRKMSKSLGNSPEPIELIEQYGADGVRVGLLLSSAAGNDLLFDEKLCEQGRNFSNKIWNSMRLIKGWSVSKTSVQPEESKKIISWYKNKFQQALSKVEKLFDQFRINEALMVIYKLIWDDYCSWYLETIKPSLQSIDTATLEATITFLENNLRLLHPFMPFLTEEIWHIIKKRSSKEALIISNYPIQTAFDKGILKEFENTQKIIAEIRSVRKEKKIPFKDIFELYILEHSKSNTSEYFNAVIGKLGNISKISNINEKPKNALSFRIGPSEYFIPISQEINLQEETDKIINELSYLKGSLERIQIKLNNKKFISNAPYNIISNERKKESDVLTKIKILKASLKKIYDS